MKKNVIWVATIFCSAFITACSMPGSFPKVSEEQMEAISEYAAFELLKHDANNKSRLVDDATIQAYDERVALMEELKNTEDNPEEEMQEPQEDVNGNPTEDDESQQVVNYDSLNSFYAFPSGIVPVYAGHEVCDIYPEDEETDEFFTIDATDGKKILVLKFILMNTTEQEADIDLFGTNSVYKITIADTTKGVFTTMLLNDMSTYRGTLQPGEEKELVLLTEMDDENLTSVEEIILRIKNNQGDYLIKLE